MSARLHRAFATLLLIALAVPAVAQTGGQSGQPSAQDKAMPDPLGRETPRGTIAGFDQAVRRGDFESAAEYLQVPAARRQGTEELARDLKDLIDRYYLEPIVALSDAPEGMTNDGLPPGRDRVVLRVGAKPVDIVLVRVKDPDAGQIWLISAQALLLVPSLRQSAEATWLERLLPQGLVAPTMFGIPIARWIVWAASFVVPFVVLSLLSTLGIRVARRVIADPAHRRLLDTWYGGLRRLLVVVLTLGIQVLLMPLLGFSLRFRIAYRQFSLVAFVIAFAWLVWRFMALSFADARLMAQRRSQPGVRSLLMLAERVCKLVVVMLAVFALLKIFGVDTNTALAGVGIGGVAVALGAQKSVENLLGGVFLITDRALAVGDTCSISNRVGVVEDITMRSVRLRTTEQTLLSVPAGLLSQSSLENFATRNKILVRSILRLHYGTTTQQLRRVLAAIRVLLDAHPDLENESASIRLVDFGVRAIELELFAYVATAEVQRFQAVREDLLLQVAAIVESSGTSFAQPTLVYDQPDVRVTAANSSL